MTYTITAPQDEAPDECLVSKTVYYIEVSDKLEAQRILDEMIQEFSSRSAVESVHP
jgi:hypothetical protein